jgi:hypothetical protein
MELRRVHNDYPLNIIDLENLHLHKPVMFFDLPGNERRMLQEVDGYRYTIKPGPERAYWGLVVRMRSIGGAENAA